jgi:hypothetical protein
MGDVLGGVVAGWPERGSEGAQERARTGTEGYLTMVMGSDPTVQPERPPERAWMGCAGPWATKPGAGLIVLTDTAQEEP